jgi:hypothetical protein
MMRLFAISFSGCLRPAKDDVACSAMVCTHKLTADFVSHACESGIHEIATSHTCSFDFETLLVRGETVGGPRHAVQVGAHMGACEIPRRQRLGARGPIRCLVEIGLMKRTMLGEFECEISYLVIQ